MKKCLISITPTTNKLISEFNNDRGLFKGHGLISFLLENRVVIFSNREIFNGYVEKFRDTKKEDSTSRIYLPDEFNYLNEELKNLKSELDLKSSEEVIVGFIGLYKELVESVEKEDIKIEDKIKNLSIDRLIKKANEVLSVVEDFKHELELVVKSK